METGQGNLQDLNRATREIWDSKARFWDERMGEGNQFQQVLIGPASERLLQVQHGGTDVASQLGAHIGALDRAAVPCPECSMVSAKRR